MPILKYETIRNQTVITLETQTLDSRNTPRVSQRMQEVLESETDAVIDLGPLRHFDAVGFAAMLQWTSGKNGCEVCLCSKSRRVQALFEMLSANTLVPLFQSREEAMSAIGRLGISKGDSLPPPEDPVFPGRHAAMEP